MTTPNEELRKQLQQIYKSGELYYRVISDAAYLPQAQAERIKELESEVEMWKATANAVVDFEKVQLRAQLAEIAATEPSMIYHGRCVIDCGDSGHQDVTMLKMIARETKLYARPMPAQGVKDAERYRWLREQHWSTDAIAVVLNPKQAVKLGHVCPSDSLLDFKILSKLLSCA